MDAGERKMMRELDEIVERIAEQAELYDRTENWSIDGEEGPVDLDLARYVLPDSDYFLELWSEVHEAAKNDSGLPVSDRSYQELDERIRNHRDFIEDVYNLEKPLGRAKVEAQYPW